MIFFNYDSNYMIERSNLYLDNVSIDSENSRSQNSTTPLIKKIINLILEIINYIYRGIQILTLFTFVHAIYKISFIAIHYFFYMPDSLKINNIDINIAEEINLCIKFEANTHLVDISIFSDSFEIFDKDKNEVIARGFCLEKSKLPNIDIDYKIKLYNDTNIKDLTTIIEKRNLLIKISCGLGVPIFFGFGTYSFKFNIIKEFSKNKYNDKILNKKSLDCLMNNEWSRLNDIYYQPNNFSTTPSFNFEKFNIEPEIKQENGLISIILNTDLKLIVLNLYIKELFVYINFKDDINCEIRIKNIIIKNGILKSIEIEERDFIQHLIESIIINKNHPILNYNIYLKKTEKPIFTVETFKYEKDEEQNFLEIINLNESEFEIEYSTKIFQNLLETFRIKSSLDVIFYGRENKIMTNSKIEIISEDDIKIKVFFSQINWEELYILYNFSSPFSIFIKNIDKNINLPVFEKKLESKDTLTEIRIHPESKYLNGLIKTDFLAKKIPKNTSMLINDFFFNIEYSFFEIKITIDKQEISSSKKFCFSCLVNIKDEIESEQSHVLKFNDKTVLNTENIPSKPENLLINLLSKIYFDYNIIDIENLDFFMHKEKDSFKNSFRITNSEDISFQFLKNGKSVFTCIIPSFIVKPDFKNTLKFRNINFIHKPETNNNKFKLLYLGQIEFFIKLSQKINKLYFSSETPVNIISRETDKKITDEISRICGEFTKTEISIVSKNILNEMVIDFTNIFEDLENKIQKLSKYIDENKNIYIKDKEPTKNIFKEFFERTLNLNSLSKIKFKRPFEIDVILLYKINKNEYKQKLIASFWGKNLKKIFIHFKVEDLLIDWFTENIIYDDLQLKVILKKDNKHIDLFEKKIIFKNNNFKENILYCFTEQEILNNQNSFDFRIRVRRIEYINQFLYFGNRFLLYFHKNRKLKFQFVNLYKKIKLISELNLLPQHTNQPLDILASFEFHKNPEYYVRKMFKLFFYYKKKVNYTLKQENYGKKRFIFRIREELKSFFANANIENSQNNILNHQNNESNTFKNCLKTISIKIGTLIKSFKNKFHEIENNVKICVTRHPVFPKIVHYFCEKLMQNTESQTFEYENIYLSFSRNKKFTIYILLKEMKNIPFIINHFNNNDISFNINDFKYSIKFNKSTINKTKVEEIVICFSYNVLMENENSIIEKKSCEHLAKLDNIFLSFYKKIELEAQKNKRCVGYFKKVSFLKTVYTLKYYVNLLFSYEAFASLIVSFFISQSLTLIS